MPKQTIVLKNVEELEQKFLQAVHILMKMRKAQKKFRNTYAQNDINIQKYWEEKADVFIEQMPVRADEYKDTTQLQVNLNEPDAH